MSEILKGVLGTALGEIGMGCTARDLITTQAVGMTLTLMSYEGAEDLITDTQQYGAVHVDFIVHHPP